MRSIADARVRAATILLPDTSTSKAPREVPSGFSRRRAPRVRARPGWTPRPQWAIPPYPPRAGRVSGERDPDRPAGRRPIRRRRAWRPIPLCGVVPGAAAGEDDGRGVGLLAVVPVECRAQRIEHRRPRDLAQQGVQRRSEQRGAALAGDRQVEQKPMGGLRARVETHVVDQPLPRVEIELEGQRPLRLGEQVPPVGDQLELARGTGQLRVAELRGERAGRELVQRTLEHHGDVDVAHPGLIPTSSRRAHERDGHERVAELSAHT